ncbi:MAG: thiamine pyrophosphate-dependent enzyme [Nanoarchaeota archaeon]|nr:2-oxoacid:ferredoxin oxidoreductase subunit beta [Nanoarchaeota archaeon]
MTKTNLSTKQENTWCPGCTNFLILEAVKKALSKTIEKGTKQEEIAMVTGIGCHAKIFDYLNISGIYGLHGRVLPTALGIKLGNPNLTVLGFAGDGDTYAEGMAHFIHAGRYNSDMTLIVHNNQAFSLTTGQATPVSQEHYVNKAEPLGEFNHPLNPIKLALCSGASFVARCNAKDIEHTSQIIEKAIEHNGFSFVEIIQNCLIFNKEMNELDNLFYKIENKENKKTELKEAIKLSDKWDYNSNTEKIPIGIFYSQEKPTLEEKWPQLSKLKNKKISWKDLKNN